MWKLDSSKGQVSLWLTQNESMEEHEETSELRDSEDDHDIKNGDKLEGNSSTNCDYSYFKYISKCFYFLMFEDDGSHCKNIRVGLDRKVDEFSRGRGGTRYIPWWRGAAQRFIPWPCFRQILLIFLPCLRQNSDFCYPVKDICYVINGNLMCLVSMPKSMEVNINEQEVVKMLLFIVQEKISILRQKLINRYPD